MDMNMKREMEIAESYGIDRMIDIWCKQTSVLFDYIRVREDNFRALNRSVILCVTDSSDGNIESQKAVFRMQLGHRDVINACLEGMLHDSEND